VISSAILRLNCLVTLDPDSSGVLDFTFNSGSINLLDSADYTADITDRDAEFARPPAGGLVGAIFEGGIYESLFCADCSGSCDCQQWLYFAENLRMAFQPVNSRDAISTGPATPDFACLLAR
jgi:hypothetical protein